MTSTITRRGAIATMASGAVAATLAATTVGVAVAKSAPDDDSYLLNLTAKFHKHYAQAHTAHVTWVSEKDRVDALPDCPAFPLLGRAEIERYGAFLKSHGTSRLSDKSNAASRRVRKTGTAIFDLRARTVPGVLEKVRVAHLVLVKLGVPALYSAPYLPDAGGLWIESIMVDLERIAGVS